MQKHQIAGSQTNIKRRFMTPPNTSDASEQAAVSGLQLNIHSPAAWTRSLVRLHRECLLLGEPPIPSHFEDLPCAAPPSAPALWTCSQSLHIFTDNVSDATAECHQPVLKKTDCNWIFFLRERVQPGSLGASPTLGSLQLWRRASICLAQ